MPVVYEWDLEEFDENGDVLDHHHAEELLDLPDPEDNQRIVLVRDESADFEEYGVQDRQWAYPVNGVLPETFDGGAAVPARFRKEWETHGFRFPR